MSQELISRNQDLRRLRDEGYEVAIKSNLLIVTNIPYLNSKSKVMFGTLVSTLTLSGESTIRPDNHVIHFIGEEPHHIDGTLISQIRHSSIKNNLAEAITIDHTFSNKPNGGFADYYDKLTSYISILENEAKAIDGNLTAKTFKICQSDDGDAIFNYPDTNSSRSEIIKISDKLKGQKVGIIGLGGTGSYILDFIAKTPVKEIRLFDGDQFLSHNAFRAPGAPTLEELNSLPFKATYFQMKYSNMHKNIIPFNDYIKPDNLCNLDCLDFVFICIDKGTSKLIITELLKSTDTSFIDVGMGLEVVDESIIGILRTTTSTKESRPSIDYKQRISFENNEEDVYSNNIQIAELNAMNASTAVIKWKKTLGFYQDLVKEHHSTYSINDNNLNSEDET